MYQYPFKICDPIHGFIRFDEIEKKVIDSRAYQRLRYIHQMGVAYLVYPGATHTRFEHSLGVMELATRLFDTLLSPHHILNSQKPFIPTDQIPYWRRILRLAALCHDLGHLPFSHTAEKELLPEGGHEKMTLMLIQTEELRSIWNEIGDTAEEDIIKLVVSEKQLKSFGQETIHLSDWERVLSKIITEDNFGADRIDYLVRDAYYTGVGYGHFDYHQLMDSLRIVPDQKTGSPTIGIAESGIQSVESLWMARYLMYARVYHHPRARLYSHHLTRFMVYHYQRGFPQNSESYLIETDYRVLSSLSEAAALGNEDAKIILKEKPPYVSIPLNKTPKESIMGLQKKFPTIFIDDLLAKKGEENPEAMRDFAVLKDKELETVISSKEASLFLREIPLTQEAVRVFASQKLVEEVQSFLERSSSKNK